MKDDGSADLPTKAIPGWGWCFIATIIVFLLQLFPLTGFLLMFLLAMGWSVILVNLGFALMLLDVLAGRAPRFLALLPILWFGGYAVATFVSHRQAADFIRGIDQRNHEARIAWIPASRELLLAPDAKAEDESTYATATALVERYGLEQVFTHHPFSQGEGDDNKTAIVASACPAPRADHEDDDRSAYNTRVLSEEPSGPDGRSRYHVADRLCEQQGRGHPVGQITVVSTGPVIRKKGLLLDTEIQPIVVRTARGTSIAYTGQAEPITWLPIPILGCGLVDKSSSWECSAQFWREKASGSEKNQKRLAAIASVLGLNESTPMKRFPNAGWRQAI